MPREGAVVMMPLRPRSAAILMLALSGPAVAAQQVVPVAEEPMHRLMLETESFQVLDPLLMPGDTTLFHSHDAPIHYVMISPSPANAQTLGDPWPEGSVDQLTRTVGEGWWTLDYGEHPVVHRVTNIGAAPFRLIAVTNLGDARPSEMSEEVQTSTPLPGTIEAESSWFVRARASVGADSTVVVPAGLDPVVAIQVSPGRVEASDDEGLVGSTDAVGGWVVLDPGARHELRSSSPEDVTIVLVQVVAE
jgi:hypothetical protein